MIYLNYIFRKGATDMSIGSEIKNIRLKSYMSQVEFAAALNVSFSTVNRWENDKATPNFQTIKRIKAFCDSHNIDFKIDLELLKR